MFDPKVGLVLITIMFLVKEITKIPVWALDSQNGGLTRKLL